MEAKRTSVRYHFLDEVRGFAVVCMVFFHAFYLWGYLFHFKTATALYEFFVPAEPYFAGAFIVISGICSCFSRSNLKRGCKLLGVALAVSLVTYLAGFWGLDIFIQFGILHLLSFSMITGALLFPLLRKIPAVLGLIGSALLFAFTYGVSDGYIGFGPYSAAIPQSLQSLPWLFPIGIYADGFFSADYFPVFPWWFAFLGGIFAGLLFFTRKIPQFLKNQHIRPLSYAGRHALVIYILHQPVLYGITAAIAAGLEQLGKTTPPGG